MRRQNIYSSGWSLCHVTCSMTTTVCIVLFVLTLMCNVDAENFTINNDNDEQSVHVRNPQRNGNSVPGDKQNGNSRHRRSVEECHLLQSCESDSYFRNCRCDDQCSVYKDCCYDAPRNITAHNSIRQSCRLLDSENAEAYWMVSNCPSSFKDQQIIEKCETYASDLGDPYQVEYISICIFSLLSCQIIV